MSGVQVAEGGDPPIHEDVDRVARANGWRPKDQFKGDPEKWVSADVFVARGLENPDMLRANNTILVQKMERMERSTGNAMNEMKSQLGDALGTVATMTTMMRTAEQRAYERARRELKAERDKAVETGDTATFQRLDAAVEELDKTKPAEPPAKVAPAVAPPANGGQPPPPPPEATAFFARNPWYQREMDLQREADNIYKGLQETRADLTLEQNLAEVERRMKMLFPDRTGAPKRTPTPTVEDPEDDPQDAPSAVTPSSNGLPPRKPARNTFDAMPKESKDAYTKYADQMKRADDNAGKKHEPLSKTEWAATYWGQFKDDGT